MHEFPSALGDTDHVLEFFAEQFGFDEKETTAILGLSIISLSAHFQIAKVLTTPNKYRLRLRADNCAACLAIMR